jgi:hypothetical protein
VDGKNMPILAIHPTIEYLSAMDEIPNVPAIMVIPFRYDEIGIWVEKHNAILYGNEPNFGPADLDPYVMSQIQQIHNAELGTLKYIAESVAKNILDKGFDFDPRQIRWTLTNKLNTSMAKAVLASEMMERIRNSYEGKKMTIINYNNFV